jgi:hypothetical protein
VQNKKKAVTMVEIRMIENGKTNHIPLTVTKWVANIMENAAILTVVNSKTLERCLLKIIYIDYNGLVF